MLTARNLCIAYDSTTVLSGVSIDLAPGEVVGVLGPNGAGKSTLARALLGLLDPVAGEVRIDDALLSTMEISARAKHVAAVLQDQGPKFSFTVNEVVTLAREARRPAFTKLDASDFAAVAAALKTADVEALAERPYDALSGGERQRVLLARALAQQTRYLVLDEPTAFLDLHHRYAFADRVKVLAEHNGVGILWILHDLDLALRDCHRIYVLAAGKCVAQGPPLAVLTPALLRTVFGVEAALHLDQQGRGHVLVERPV